jgi:hypothetical protein
MVRFRDAWLGSSTDTHEVGLADAHADAEPESVGDSDADPVVAAVFHEQSFGGAIAVSDGDLRRYLGAV